MYVRGAPNDIQLTVVEISTGHLTSTRCDSSSKKCPVYVIIV